MKSWAVQRCYIKLYAYGRGGTTPKIEFHKRASFSILANAQEFPVDKCFDKDVVGIPKCHIYHKKCKPVVFGHRGNPKKFQENTLDGFQSVLGDGADGFEVDVFLSKDKQVVCFHDDNAEV